MTTTRTASFTCDITIRSLIPVAGVGPSVDLTVFCHGPRVEDRGPDVRFLLDIDLLLGALAALLR